MAIVKKPVLPFRSASKMLRSGLVLPGCDGSRRRGLLRCQVSTARRGSVIFWHLLTAISVSRQKLFNEYAAVQKLALFGRVMV